VIAGGVVVLIAALAIVYSLTGSGKTFDPVRYQQVANECEAATDHALKLGGIELEGMTNSQRDAWITENNACLRRRLGTIPDTTPGDAVAGS